MVLVVTGKLSWYKALKSFQKISKLSSTSWLFKTLVQFRFDNWFLKLIRFSVLKFLDDTVGR